MEKSEQVTFCEICRKDVSYAIDAAKMMSMLRGETYNYSGKRATCNECGSEVYVADVEDANLDALNKVRKREFALKSAIHSVRMEGLELSQEAIDDGRLLIEGKVTADELAAKYVERYRRNG